MNGVRSAALVILAIAVTAVLGGCGGARAAGGGADAAVSTETGRFTHPSVTEIPYGKADDGPWFMGANKDGTAISYTSPCSKGAGTHEYVITIYALSQTPPGLPDHSTLDVTHDVLEKAIAGVSVIDTATLKFVNVTP